MKKLFSLLIVLIFTAGLAACSTQNTISSVPATVDDQDPVEIISTAAAAATPVGSSTETPEENSATHEAASDYTWDSANVIDISLNGSTARSEGAGVEIAGSVITITAAGTYSLSGALSDGQVVVDTTNKEVVRLILNGVDITSTSSAPIYIKDAEKTILILAENSQNTLTDGTAYVYTSAEEDEPNAVIFSKANLTLYGSGSLTVNGNYNDGISGKDGLLIAGSTITVNAADDGIRGKDYLVVKDGILTVTATGDGLKADNEDDAALGFITIENGSLNITAGGDAITAQTDVLISGGELTLASGGGSGTWLDETTSAKGIKGIISVTIDGGTFTINSADDSIHSNGDITINNGTFQLATGDDGMHADTTLTINGGEIVINESYEGIESAVITINGGNIHINSSDDGINVASGADGSGANPGMFGGGGQGNQPGGRQGGGPGADMFSAAGDYYLYINGGYIVVNADGDGIDVNGAIEMTDGVALVNGPTENMNGALDYYTTFNISGGYLVAVGSAGMAQGLSESSTQNSLLVNLDNAQPAGTTIHIQDEAGGNVLTFTPTKYFQSIVFSAPGLETGKDYILYTGGNVSGEVMDGLSTSGSYFAGTQVDTFSVENTVTSLGSTNGRMPGRRP